MKYFDKAVYLFVIYIFSTSWVFAQTGRNLALKLRGNVVHLQASFEESAMRRGFGFVIGERNNLLYIVTASHVVIDDNAIEENKPNELKVKFYQLDETFQGEVLRYDREKDVAIISVEKPDEFEWKKNAVDNNPKEGGKAYYIGKVNEWTVPTEAAVGGIIKINEVENTITAENLNIAPGSSGGPLLSKKGIIGVITQHEGDAIAVGLKAIENIATNDGQYAYMYSMRPSTKTLMISGLGVLGATGAVLGIQQINKANDLHDHYTDNKNPISSQYPYEGLSRPELYEKADGKYKKAQAFIIGGGVALGAAAWLLLKDRIIQPRDRLLSKLSITPQVFMANGFNNMGTKGFHVVYTF